MNVVVLGIVLVVAAIGYVLVWAALSLLDWIFCDDGSSREDGRPW